MRKRWSFDRGRDNSNRRNAPRRKNSTSRGKPRARRKLLMERFEDRAMLAGPQLISIIPNEGSILVDGDIRNVAPRELTFRFDQNQVIDVATLGGPQIATLAAASLPDGTKFALNFVNFEIDKNNSVTAGNIRVAIAAADTSAQVATKVAAAINGQPLGVTAAALGSSVNLVGAVQLTSQNPLVTVGSTGIQIERSADGTFGNGNDVPIIPGFVGIGNRPNEVVVRFSSALPDDQYRIKVVGTGANPLRNEPGEAFEDGLEDDVRVVRLDLGAQVLAVVPQPVLRNNATGKLDTNPDLLRQIDVYFNPNDPLDVASVTNPAFYQLIVTQGTLTNADDVVFSPTSIIYDSSGGKVQLQFANRFDLLGTGAFRLRVGDSDVPPNLVKPQTPIGITPPAEGVAGSPGSMFSNSADVGTLGNQGAIGHPSKIVNAAIESLFVDPGLTFPGSNFEPGHRDIPAESHIDQAFSTGGIPTIFYNFRDDYGTDPIGNPLQNLITEPQKQRAREVLQLYSYYAGVNFVETDNQGIIIATGDPRAVDSTIPPLAVGGIAGNTTIGQAAIMNSGIDWANSEYGGAFFRTTMHEIGHLLGLGHSYDLPPLTIQGSSEDLGPIGTAEQVFPGDHDIVHTQFAYRPDSTDIDLYKFVVQESGKFSAEVIAERQSTPSLLDSLLTLYSEFNVLRMPAGGAGALTDGQFFSITDADGTSRTYEIEFGGGVVGGRIPILVDATDTARDVALQIEAVVNADAQANGLNVVVKAQLDRVLLNGPISVNAAGIPPFGASIERQVIARNDDYYGKDAFLDLNLDPGRYFVAVTSTGNSNFDPDAPDSGYGGTTKGIYDLRLNFVPDLQNSNRLVDVTGTPIDGDSNGTPGGAFNFWFNVGPTIYVDKAAPAGGVGPLGSITNPYTNLGTALGAAGVGSNVRVVANPGTDGNLATPIDAKPYLIGFDIFNAPLADGTTLNVPLGVTVMVDAGAVIKFRQANINVGSTAVNIDRSNGALQILGTPSVHPVLTSWHDNTAGGRTDSPDTPPLPGDWGGIAFRNDLDNENPAVVTDESKGIFKNFVNQAFIRYGGGNVIVNSVLQSFTPIHLTEARPTVSFNVITNSADAAVSGDPNSYEDTRYGTSAFTSDYARFGPDVHGNLLFNNSINAMFIRIRTDAGEVLDKLEVPARFDDTDIVHVISENLLIRGLPSGRLDTASRLDGRLDIDEGVIVKLLGSRIETQLGDTALIAEARAGQQTIFTSLRDDRYGAGGTFDTNGDRNASLPKEGDWGGLFFGPTSTGSLDQVLVTFGGGTTTVEGDFDRFSPVEIHQAQVRITNSSFILNADGFSATNRNGRGRNHPAAIYVLGAQPVIVNNVFIENLGASIDIDANSMKAIYVPDFGRLTGRSEEFSQYANNLGPLVRLNRTARNGVNGMEIRGGTLTTEAVWDDTDITHALRGEIVIDNYHSFGGLRLQSNPTESLVIKLNGPNAGFTAKGTPLDISDRIGGAVQVLGQPGHPVVLTSVFDCSVGAGLTPDGTSQNDVVNGCDIETQPGNSGPVFLDGGDRDDHGSFDTGTGTNLDGWKFIEQAVNFAVSTSRNTAGAGVLVVGTQAGTQARDAIQSAANVLGLTLTFVNDVAISTVNFAAFKAIYVPSDDSNTNGGIIDSEIDRLTARKLEIQDFINNTGGGFIALTEEGSANPYAFLELPLPFVIQIGGGTDLAQTPELAAAGFNITDQELSNGTPWHNYFVGPPGFNNLQPWVLAVPGGEIVTLGLPAGSAGIGVSPVGPGDWRSIRLDKYSNDRNVDVINEVEKPLTGGTGTNDLPDAAQLLGSLAPNEKSGDDILRLGFEVHGLISPDFSKDQDVYSFRAKTGSEVWFDIDLTSAPLDTVLELIDANGTVLAKSNDSVFETQAVLSGLVPNSLARVMQRDVYDHDVYNPNNPNLRDYNSINIRDAGMRVVLPGQPNSTNTYFIRVSSKDGLTSGNYQLQVRLRELDEQPGSSVQNADIRYALNGVEVLGMPGSSPLLGESYEAFNNGEINNTSNVAQNIGPLQESSKSAISLGGRVSTANDVDWYRFTLDYNRIQTIAGYTDGDRTWATVFDIDYADGVTRPDTVLAIYDENFNLIAVSRDSNIVDDQPAPAQGADTDDLSRSTFGKLDPYIGSMHLPNGRDSDTGQTTYFVAVMSNAQVPYVLKQNFVGDAPRFTNGGVSAGTVAEPLARLEPINSIRRIAEDHIGFSGGSTADPVQTQLFTANPADPLDPIPLNLYAKPFQLSDVTLFIQTPSTPGQDGRLYTVDPYTGAAETGFLAGEEVFVTGEGFGYRDIAIRSDEQLFGLALFPGDDSNAGDLYLIDPGTGDETDIEDGDNVETAFGFGIQMEAMAFHNQVGGTRELYGIGNGDGIRNGLYQLNPDTGFPIFKPFIGEIFSEPDANGLLPAWPSINAVRATDPSGNPPRLEDGQVFTIADQDGTLVHFEFDSGPELRINGGPLYDSQNIRDEQLFMLDGQWFEMNSGEVIVLPNGTTAGTFLVDGDRVRITDTGNVKRTFEFDNNGSWNSANTRIPYTNGEASTSIGNKLVSAINTSSTLVGAININNRITLVGDMEVEILNVDPAGPPTPRLPLPGTSISTDGNYSNGEIIIAPFNTLADTFIEDGDAVRIIDADYSTIIFEWDNNGAQTIPGSTLLSFVDTGPVVDQDTDTSIMQKLVDAINASPLNVEAILTEDPDPNVQDNWRILLTNDAPEINPANGDYLAITILTVDPDGGGPLLPRPPLLSGSLEARVDTDARYTFMINFEESNNRDITGQEIEDRVDEADDSGFVNIEASYVRGRINFLGDADTAGGDRPNTEDMTRLKYSPPDHIGAISEGLFHVPGSTFGVTSIVDGNPLLVKPIPFLVEDPRLDFEMFPFPFDPDVNSISDRIFNAVNEANFDEFAFPGFNVIADNWQADVDLGILHRIEFINASEVNLHPPGRKAAEPPLTSDGLKPLGGTLTGLASLGGKLYTVSDRGSLYEITNPGDWSLGASAKHIPAVQLEGLHFSGLTNGPKNVEGGAFANLLFATTREGRMYAFNASGVLQPIFAGGATSVALPAGVNPTGLAFSNLDFNLWHVTPRRGGSLTDPTEMGHGINLAVDHSRDDLPVEQRQGGLSWYFGIENRLPSDPYYQPGSENYVSNPALYNTYNFAGGAYGTFDTNSFNLSQYSRQDKPTMYFNYVLSTESADSNATSMFDAARVFASTDNGVTWFALTTNNSVLNAELPDFVSPSADVPEASFGTSKFVDARQRVQELFDESPVNAAGNRGNSGNVDRAAGDFRALWRQARVDLGDFAGKSNIKLRIGFSTSGVFDDPSSKGNYSQTLPGDQFGNFNSIRRSQVNNREGFYIDDIIIGFSERGEMVTMPDGLSNAAVRDSHFTIPVSPDPTAPSQVLVGDYQLEIRRGTKYESNINGLTAVTHLDRSFDTNDRLTQAFTLVAPAGSSISDGMKFRIHNGLDAIAAGQNTFTFEFNNAGGVGSTNGVSHIAIAFNVADSAAVIAQKVRNAINSATTLGVTADIVENVFSNVTTPTGFRVNLHGATNVTNISLPASFILNQIDPAHPASFDQVGDSDVFRAQGQTLISDNFFFASKEQAIKVDASSRDAGGSWTHPGGVINTTTRDATVPRLVPGITINNNVISSSGVAGILFSGDANPAGQSVAAMPFGRIVNNTIVGQLDTNRNRFGTGILVTENASPTILNNILSELVTGISVDLSSNTSVLGGNLYKHNVTNSVLNGAAENFVLSLADTDPLFLNLATRNFYLAPAVPGLPTAIDSSVNSLVDRASMTTITGPMGIAPSPILAPELDVFGQLRVDDPTVAPPPGLGSNVFKERGAIERADFAGPVAQLFGPRDNDVDDQNPLVNVVHLVEASPRQFSIQLVDAVGVGVDDSTVDVGRFRVRQNGFLLQAGVDYQFVYDNNNKVVSFVAAAGVWLNGNEFTIELDNGVIFDGQPSQTAGVLDLAGNPLQPNETSGATRFRILLDSATNDAPVVRVPNTQTTFEDTNLRFSLFRGNSISVFDVDVGTGILKVLVSVTHGTMTLGSTTGLTFTSPADGTDDATMEFFGTLVDINTAFNNMIFKPEANFVGQAVLDIAVDDQGLTGPPGPKVGTGQVKINILPVNDPPFVANPIADRTVPEDSAPILVSTVGVFDDIDLHTAEGDNLVITVSGNTNPGLVTATLVGTDIRLTFAPNASGIADITVRATDKGGLFAEDTFRVTVLIQNDPPFLVNPIADRTVDEDAPPLNVSLAGVFNDTDIPSGDVLMLTVSGNSNPSLVSTQINGTTLTLTFLPNQNGQATITVRATDQAGAFVEDSFVVTVRPINDAPQARNDAYLFEKNTPLVVTSAQGVLANDTDVDNANLSAILFDVPKHGKLALNANGSFTYTPDPGFNGLDTFIYRADDGALRSSATVRLVGLDFRFVTKLYRDILSRTASDSDVTFWTDKIQQGTSRTQVSLNFLQSVEYRSKVINGFYQSYFGRSADQSAIGHFLGVWASTGGSEEIQIQLLSSLEFFNKSGGTNSGFITNLYNKLFNRNPGANELTFWVNRLNTGTTREQVARGFVTSDEYRLIIIDSWYQTFLGRKIDAAGGQFWLARWKSGTNPDTIEAGILGSDEYRLRP